MDFIFVNTHAHTYTGRSLLIYKMMRHFNLKFLLTTQTILYLQNTVLYNQETKNLKFLNETK